MGIMVSKELQESRNNLKIMRYIQEGDHEKRDWLRKEAEELITIAVCIIKNKL